MKYEYVGFPGKDPKAAVYRPYLVVRVASRFTDTFCLIDSGADYCMMPASLGRLIGIDVKSGPEQEIAASAVGEKLGASSSELLGLVPLTGILTTQISVYN
jgi:hypothetical protein